MRLLLDSNVWIDARKGLPEAVRVIEEATRAEWAGFSAITRLEVFGFPGLTKEDEAAFEILLGEFIEVPVTSEVIAAAITLRQQHRMKSPDAIIAVTAQLQGAVLFTRNLKDFEKVEGLSVQQPK